MHMSTMYSASDLIQHVKSSKQKADNLLSNLTPQILAMQGMSGIKTRHFYNNLCSLPHSRYLEVGSWQGSTLIASLYKNTTCAAVAIDNWSEFGGPRENFNANVKRFIPDAWLHVIEADCFKADLDKRKFNIYLFDGAHDFDSQRKAITYFYENLDMPCILIVDDWNWEKVRGGTFAGLKDVNATVVFQDHVQHTTDDSHTPRDIAAAEYWNGMGLFVLDKPSRRILL
jgi:hypothetical protein